MKYLIAGLGNIGDQYRGTRHNIGFMVIDRLLAQFEKEAELVRHAHVAKARHRGRSLILIKPTTYMNLSGKAVRYYKEAEKIDLANVLVITDDLALPFGRNRLRGKGSDGGHNGLKNINELLGTQTYPRMRVGVGNDYPKGGQVDYVLSPFSEEEQPLLPEIVDRCAKAVLSFVSVGLAQTMTDFNKK